MVGVMLLAIALLAVIVDGGNVLSQQRISQTGSDASAEAGAIVLAERLAGATIPVGGWDATVAAKVAASASANGLTIKAAYYTDICGIPLQADGSGALNGDGTENLAVALQVGTGALPGGAATVPDCPSRRVGPVQGVLVIGEKQVASFVARAISIPSFTVTTRATAVSGYLQGLREPGLVVRGPARRHPGVCAVLRQPGRPQSGWRAVGQGRRLHHRVVRQRPGKHRLDRLAPAGRRRQRADLRDRQP
jgi:hypothetical protein